MAGGIYISQPFSPNIKCIVFSIAMMAFYLFSPCKKNKYLLLPIFIISYILLAWYDYLYSCDVKMYTGSKGIIGVLDSPFKPQRLDDTKTYDKDIYLVPNQEGEYLKRIYLFHLIAVAPLLIYIGLKGKKTNEKLFGVLLILGVVAFTYHGMRFFYPRLK